MALTRLQSAPVGHGVSSTTVALTFSSACTPGSFIVVVTATRASSLQAGFQVSDGVNAGNYAKDAANTGGAGNCGLAITSIQNTASSALTITTNLVASVGDSWMLAEEWAGVATSSALDAGNAAASGSSTSPLSNSITTAAGNELIIGAYSLAFSTTVTAGSGYNLDPQTPGTGYIAMEYSTSNSAGSNSAGFALGASENWQCAIAAYKVAPVLTLNPVQLMHRKYQILTNNQ
jgi:hypothetical protein